MFGDTPDMFCMRSPDMKMSGDAKLPANCSQYVNKTGELVSIDGNSEGVLLVNYFYVSKSQSLYPFLN